MNKLQASLAAAALAIGLAGLTGCGAGQAATTASGTDAPKGAYTVNLANNGGGGLFLLAKEKGWFEEEFAKIGGDVKWSEFPSGPALLEALAAGRVDFSWLGDGAAISAQANNLPVTTLSLLSEGLKGLNIVIVPAKSTAQSLADLKGKKIAIAKGTTLHVFFIKAVKQAGLKESDFQLIQLQAEEAVAAFESGAVDAWVGLDPYTSIQIAKNGARVLTSGEALNIKAPVLTIGRTDFVKEHPGAAEAFLKGFEKAIAFQKEHRDEVVEFIAKAKKADRATIELVVQNTEYSNVPISKEIFGVQQASADILLEAGFIKKKIDVTHNTDSKAIEAVKAAK
ncbi:aliphatic sulfonate ABC transporter substrate-binding protein [Paenibacillus chitinolyticus]|uniref:Putative aliphatic sulfonates-binding protein n=1 Tax=Paenibacillus chitinolyticus TaxID=79263 RepID=A0A410WTL6_9BACL|nr:aliphatic sulfonate ABC transporter substrate-binding protein [Paenibacillus chitinolyticus]MCY9591908.1 aliphatic sulfonate ABC transporter substrate-binding protein [Paenibacillus chitinolyticus]MCY9594965.1 aliphatic sulfonate ABC transporter substrate-binding protein [Paenibacillus chitinolyticus]QAV17836.1 aliphatic sulfonate ABC transporter substrate-binding protein [Paenibacillus chitinolyticus]